MLIMYWCFSSIVFFCLRLIPALVQHAKKQQEIEGLRYLEFSVQKLEITDPAIHNYLVHLYIKYRPERLGKYLEDQVKKK
jgi:hypothetical protein